MIWKEKGVEKDSYMCFFDPLDVFKNHYYYMVSCGHFVTNGDYLVESQIARPPLFFYVINGGLTIDYNDCRYEVAAGEIALLNCHNTHKYFCLSDCEFLFFHFDGPDAANMVDHLVGLNSSIVFPSGAISQKIYDSIRDSIMRLCYQDMTNDCELSSLVYSTLCMMSEYNEIIPLVNTKYNDVSVASGAIEYIKNNINKMITLDELAKDAGLNSFYFSRVFKKETGYSPIDYVALTKINYAKLMLRTTSISISEISDLLGYSSPSSFNNAFKARRGMSPKKYRDSKSQHDYREN